MVYDALFYLLEFLSGALLASGVPHFVQGVSGAPFQSLFAKPPGVGESSPVATSSGVSAILLLAYFCFAIFARAEVRPLPAG
jgi:hypothetical protein